MSNELLLVKKSPPLKGEVYLSGAKNSVLAIMASLILVKGESVLENVPNSADVRQMILLLEDLGGKISFDKDKNILKADTRCIAGFQVSPQIMNKMRASILVMGPLLARFKTATVALPGGCLIGQRPIDLHLKGLKKLGVKIVNVGNYLYECVSQEDDNRNSKIVALDYPSVGATENILMFSVKRPGKTIIINSAFEPEVLDLVAVLRKMGAKINLRLPATIEIEGVDELAPVNHSIMPDRLEAGTLLLAGVATGGAIFLPNAIPSHLDIFLDKLEEMGHFIERGGETGVKIVAAQNFNSVSFKTLPYPGFPTDLQAPMMAVLSFANGISYVSETVFENRFLHVKELGKMGAQISVNGRDAVIRGVDSLYGADVIATDIRASCALIIAGLAANGVTRITGLQHFRRGYDKLEQKLQKLGASIELMMCPNNELVL